MIQNGVVLEKKRQYRSVFVNPICTIESNQEEVRAYGALFVDSTSPFVFFNRDKTLEMLVQPYLAALALTYPPDSEYCRSEYAARH